MAVSPRAAAHLIERGRRLAEHLDRERARSTWWWMEPAGPCAPVLPGGPQRSLELGRALRRRPAPSRSRGGAGARGLILQVLPHLAGDPAACCPSAASSVRTSVRSTLAAFTSTWVASCWRQRGLLRSAPPTRRAPPAPAARRLAACSAGRCPARPVPRRRDRAWPTCPWPPGAQAQLGQVAGHPLTSARSRRWSSARAQRLPASWFAQRRRSQARSPITSEPGRRPRP
jgi:hypothetical protein